MQEGGQGGRGHREKQQQQQTSDMELVATDHSQSPSTSGSQSASSPSSSAPSSSSSGYPRERVDRFYDPDLSWTKSIPESVGMLEFVVMSAHTLVSALSGGGSSSSSSSSSAGTSGGGGSGSGGGRVDHLENEKPLPNELVSCFVYVLLIRKREILIEIIMDLPLHFK